MAIIQVDSRKVNDALIHSQDVFRLKGAPDPQTQTTAEWKAAVADTLKYGDPEVIEDMVLIRQSGAEHHHKIKNKLTSIEIPDSAKKDPGMGVVVAVAWNIDRARLKPGDIVKFSLYSAEDVEYDGEKFALVHYRDIKYREPLLDAIEP